MIQYMKKMLDEKPNGHRVSARKLFETQRSRRAMICLFLALLELVKYQAISLQQSELFGDIDISKEKTVDDIFQGPQAIEQLEQDYK
jgi:segregation and condensation protein A